MNYVKDTSVFKLTTNNLMNTYNYLYQVITQFSFFLLQLHFTCLGMDDEDDDISPLHEMLDDKSRVSYFKAYLAAIHQAILCVFSQTCVS